MTTATEPCPRQAALAADLNRWDAELPKLVTARLAAAKAVDAAREALAKAQDAERQARTDEAHATDAMRRTVAKHAAVSPGSDANKMADLHRLGDTLRQWQATGTGNPDRIAPTLAKVNGLLIQSLHGPVTIDVRELRESCR